MFGGTWASFRVWRTDVDEEEDAPAMGPETNDNTASESARGHRSGYTGVRVEGEFWRDEWIEHQGKSTRVRGDGDQNLPHFIVDTDGSRKFSAELNDEDIGRWLWLGSNKLLQDILAQKAGEARAREIFAVIAGAYDMRPGDAHPTSSKIDEALKLAGIDTAASYLRQGEQLIRNFGHPVWCTGSLLFGGHEKSGG